METCYAFVVIISIVFTVWALLDFFKKKQTNEQTIDVISRQLRGVGLSIFALVLFTIGLSLCSRGKGIWHHIFGASF
jgi:hypothetical protein